jgi:DNA repair exonuclease SbcCD nuclease subunit
MSEALNHNGLLFIGDPHLSGRAPGFRKDDYPHTTLNKLRWAIEYARINNLMPVLLGDLFHYPRDNANWLLVELLDLIDEPLLAISGNHDCSENALSSDDTLSVLAAAGKLRLLDHAGPWLGRLNETTVVVGGSCWGQALPKNIDRSEAGSPAFVFWVTHHDLRFPGYEESARSNCREIPGIDLVVNGHIHRMLEDVQAGSTLWCNPGNISRVNRGDATKNHQPAVLRVDVFPDHWERQRVPVPHQPFEEVFFPAIAGEDIQSAENALPAFVKGLLTLERCKTADGSGLREFLDANLDRFDAPVSAAIRALAAGLMAEVLDGK